MWKAKGIKWAVVVLVILTMLLGTGCNKPPTITNLTPSATNVAPGTSCTIGCVASDPDGDTLTYAWAATGGAISGTGSTVTWTAPATEGTYTISVTVSDGKKAVSDSCSIVVEMKYGSIDTKSSPAGAAVYLDGVDTGNITPYLITNVDPGSHTVRLEYYHYKYREQTVTVNANETAYINWSLTYAPELTITLQPDGTAGIDAFVVDTSDINFEPSPWLFAGYDGTDITRAYFQFNVVSIPADAVITNARLALWYVGSNTGLTVPIGAYQVLGTWSESTIKWSNKPSSATTPEYTYTVPAAPTNNWVYWNITNMVTGWRNGSITNYGVVLMDTNESTADDWKVFYSSDWGTANQRPELIITYFDPTP
jgi:hypothetical protein